uniref:Non-reducing polyketide synthase atnG n=1 Tax=Arthrinium sp. TaxID=1756131 RepID=ATNG_ARTSZ|nr:RecName: Full=Non-reducing polyketide synthase atnG; Short=NR-PKS atnG; AltName: Full=Arthripenoid biosynthesis cluster protein G [Arthrinium sp.]AYO60880.1 NR-PKS AtnG [Arthrinium sp.]
MDVAAQHVFLFGDQADAPMPMVRRVVERSRHSKNLESFLQSAIDNVQLEVARLTPAERDTIGPFHSLEGLADSLKEKSDRHGIAQMVSVFIARIGELILHAENDPALLDSSTPLLSLGICGGLLPAAAVAAATNIHELIEVASYLARVNCRVAVAISRRSIEIESGPGSWAFSVLGSAVAQLPDILEDFHREQSIPRHRRAWIAVSTPTWATVFGPPSVLSKLRETSITLKKSDAAELPAFGAVHAAHLVAPNFGDLVGESPLLNRPLKTGYKLLSGSKYAPYNATTLKDLLPQIMLDIFQNETNPARVFDVGGSYLRKGGPISLYMLGATSYLVLLRRSLHTQKFEVNLKTNPPSLQNSELRGGSGSVAVIGMSGQFPGAASVDELWDVLMRREERHRKIPIERFNADDYLDETGRGSSAITTAYGCFLENPGLFDHKMFNVSPREAMQMDPGQRLLLHGVYTALEDAGLVTGSSTAADNKRISTYIGDGSDDWRDLQSQHGVDKYIVQGTQRSFTPGRINHHFKWEGATWLVDAACGSTASAVGLAYRALINRDCDTAVAGGANIIATPFWHSALSKGGFLSKTGGCKTFRADADGYCRGEAVGVVVLKRLEDALQDNDNIVSVIRGYSRNHSADTVSITRPHVPAQMRAYQAVLHNSGLEPEDISYVEMHGTGTTAGDSAELESIVNVLAQKNTRETPLVVGAIKANLGHSEAASGISSLIKASLTFRKGMVPPQVGIPEKMGSFACLDHGTVHVPGAPVSFTRESVGKTRAMVMNNFDAAGGNSCFVLEEPPTPSLKSADPRPYHVVTVSAHCQTSLEENKRQLLQFLTENKETSLADLSYTTTARRMHHTLRSAYTGGSIQDIINSLGRDLGKNHGQDKPGAPRVAFAFTGQGAHYAGMGADLFKVSQPFRTTITGLQKICVTHGFPQFAHLISDPSTPMENVSTAQIHLSLAALEIALVDLWKILGISPDLVIGHSIGEYAALYAAGVLSATDAMYLVGTRAMLLQDSLEEGVNGMLSISGTPQDVAAIVSDESVMADCEVACHNSPGMVVLGGRRPRLAELEELLRARKFKCKLLDVPYAMHSSQLDTILPGFRKAARGVCFGTPTIKVISTLTGTEQQHFDSEYLVRQTRESVKYTQAISHCLSQGLVDSATLWLEIGPGPVCLGLIRSNTNVATNLAMPSLKKDDQNWKSISSALASLYVAGKAIGWREYHSDFIDSLSLISLPSYAFDNRNFWMPYTTGGKHQDVQPISTCLHHLVSQDDNGKEQSATFTAVVSQPSLLKMIQGHKLSGITVCPAGVFAEMALTAARYVLTGGSFSAPVPSLSVIDIQIDHPITPQSGSQQVIQVNVRRPKQSRDFAVSIVDQAKPSLITAKCCIRQTDEQDVIATRRQQLDMIRPKISKLMQDAASGIANRFQGKLFYKLFANLMDYGGQYEGVKEAIVGDDFTEALATIRLPKAQDSNESCTLSPYWIDALTHLVGFLLNGNPMNSGDDVYIGTQMERMEILAKDFSPDVVYQSYAYLEPSQDSVNYRGHVYILSGDSIVGFLEGARFRKMPRTTLHRILGKAVPPKPAKETSHPSVEATAPATTNGRSSATNAQAEAPAPPVNGSNGHRKTVESVLIACLIEETGMEESEILPSTFFAEIGVDSLMSISILSEIKNETGVELNASFLMEYPTLGDAQRQLRTLERKREGANPSTNGTDVAVVVNGEKPAKPKRECNVVLMQGQAPEDSSSIPLFLLADGAGSAAAYIHLPKLGLEDDLAVYAVESPWVRDPAEFTCSFEEAAALYLAAVRAKQPRGPYLLGGWSGGGVFSYEVARRLLAAGERVLGLVVIDIRAPSLRPNPHAAAPTMDIIDQIGMLSGIERTFADDASPEAARLKRHMLSTVTCFSRLVPTPMPPHLRPERTFVVWAKKDVLPKAAYDQLPPGLDAWFYPASHDMGPNGWDELVGDAVEYSQVEGDHFSIMTFPEVTELGRVLQAAVAKCRV